MNWQEKYAKKIGECYGILSVLFAIENGPRSLLELIHQSIHHKHTIRMLKSVRVAFSCIDDAIDNETNTARYLKMETIYTNGNRSEFLDHVLTRLEEEHGNNKFVKHFLNALYRPEFRPCLTDFGNILCQQIQQEFQAKDTRNRAEATQHHLEISATNLALYAHIIGIMTKPGVDHPIPTKVEDIKTLYPQAWQIGITTQKIDDIKDAVIDATFEIDNKIISSNFLLMKLQESGALEQFLNQCKIKDTALYRYNVREQLPKIGFTTATLFQQMDQEIQNMSPAVRHYFDAARAWYTGTAFAK